MKRCRYIVFLLLAGMVGQGCSSRALHEAEAVVAQADSLWQAGLMYGIDAGDSLSLAQAYETLKDRHSSLFSFVLGSSSRQTYAHACYHYGKLLRAKDHPAEAMQAFINATHSRTRDYQILGRVYSNMGSICHLAGDFPLSYDMYEKSAEMNLRNGDSLLYFYNLNNMAYELAEQGKKEETMALLNRISVDCNDNNALSWNNLIKAELYKNLKQYDSALYYANTLDYNTYYESTKLIIRMQSYLMMSSQDSAVYHAKQVLSISTDLFDRNNALYVLTNEDESQEKSDIRRTASERSDIQKLLEIRQGKLSQAVQLLELDLAKTPDLRWLYAVIVTIIVIGSCLLLYIHRKRNQHKLLSQQVEDLTSRTIAMQVKNEELTQSYSNNYNQIKEDIDHKCTLLHDSKKIKRTLAWKNYHTMCKNVDKQFYLLASKLQSKQLLNETEIRLCILTLLDCGYDQMAELLYRSPSSMGTLKIRVAKKLGTTSRDLRSYLIENECVS
ncbi:MAG: hypothetical protein SPK97_06540 [Bacteroidales bacterium]|nr:hypothetical protein [Bacteroidales bacterium]